MEKKQKKITEIVITGGPCAGKTSGMNSIKETFEKKGYGVVFIPETATELISSGISPYTMHGNVEYQLYQMKLQLEKERIYLEAARALPGYDKVIVVCDRGLMDNKAYVTDNEFGEILANIGINEEDIYGRYDAVFHLVSAANGAEKAYTLSNNSARTETPEQAIELDNRLQHVWRRHKYYRVIDNSMGFGDKIKKLVSEIEDFMK